MKYGVFIEPTEVNVSFGDGLNGVQSIGFRDGSCGIVICRDGKQDAPFGWNHNRDTFESPEDKVFLRFDNVRSIDVVIDRLQEAKTLLR